MDDLGTALLPSLIEQGSAREHRFDGYWRDVGTVDAYWQAHMEFLPPRPKFDFIDPEWPMVSSRRSPASVSVREGADLSDMLVGGGADLGGEVRKSVIGRGVVVEKGAVVERSVIMPDAVIRAGAVVRRAIVDTESTIGRGAQVGSARGAIALIGHRRRVKKGATVGAGGRYPAAD